MIRVDRSEIRMEGPAKRLIDEAALMLHAVARTTQDSFKGDKDLDFDPDEEENQGDIYDSVIEMILTELTRLRKFDKGDEVIPADIEVGFFEWLKEMRQSEHGPSFIDYDTNAPDKNKSANIIQNIIKKSYQTDPRTVLDDDDKKALKKAEKKALKKALKKAEKKDKKQ